MPFQGDEIYVYRYFIRWWLFDFIFFREGQGRGRGREKILSRLHADAGLGLTTLRS